MSWERPDRGSRMNREVHVRFWERAEVKFLRATRHFRLARVGVTHHARPQCPDSGHKSLVRREGRANVALADFVAPRAANEGASPVPRTPAEFTAFVRQDIERWARVVRRSGARPD